jgi:ABC-2 type transport system permease protein
MMQGMQLSLDYYSKNFSPYQHKQVRIVEFPRYANFAQSFPNTIPFSESIGFIAKVDDQDPKDIDYPFYVTAHEVAHQWWAHQVIGGNTRGTTVLTETLSQYSALMVMKQRYGEAKMRRFLSYELDRYLLGRATENRKELPLAQNEDQGYIHYRKGSLVMYALQDLIGEDKVNQALQELLKKHALQGPPYPSASALLLELRKVTPSDKQYFIIDAFEDIILYENRAISASAMKLANGKYEVRFTVSSGKLRSSETGEEKTVKMKDWIDIGVDDKDRNPLLRQKHLLTGGEQSFTVIVDKEPAKAGIDPDNKLIDRKPDDNMLRVELK